MNSTSTDGGIAAQIEEALDWRYAVKKFDAAKKISPSNWSILENSLVKSPSSYGLQPWKFLVVENTDLRARLREVSWGQSQVTDASHFVVLTYREKVDAKFIDSYIQQVAKVRGVALESLKGYADMMVGDLVNGPRAQTIQYWAQRQSYIAMGFLMETAALLKVDSCPMEGLDPAKYDEILKLNGTGWKSVAAVALGYRHTEDGLQHAKKVRFDREQVIQHIK